MLCYAVTCVVFIFTIVVAVDGSCYHCAPTHTEETANKMF